MFATDNMATVQGVLDPHVWPQGTYEMNIETQKGNNRSFSRQAGKFDRHNPKTADGSLVISTITTYISDGSRLTVTLQVEDGTRNQSCSSDYER
ncbi:curli-like amyloid fiber formation chaperone CsgH [Sulfitobacter sp. 1A12126]|uniref:curli-like amyloid fiber formation chaperone CsgH n=1 Tax=Sulfitobacter sp. 1A12126 TaxID=3368591 RepID=UPI00374A083C